jgi:hypothetical protein
VIVLTGELHKYAGENALASGTEVRHCDPLDATQREVKGVKILVHGQTRAAEKRRQRKCGKLVDPPKRVAINPRVCEGCCLAAREAIGPHLRHIQFAVDECAAAMTGITEKHTDRAVFDAACCAAVLSLHAGRMQLLLDETSLVHNQHAITIAQLFDDVPAQNVARAIGIIPLRPLEQVLHAVRCGLSHPFGKLPAVLALCSTEQAFQVSQRSLSRFRMPEQTGKPFVQIFQLVLPRPRDHLHKFSIM